MLMKKYCYLFLLFCFCFSVCQPLSVEAQEVVQKKSIRIEVKNERLPEVFKRLEKESGYKIMFTYDDVNHLNVSGTIDSSDIKVVMNMIIGDKPLDYRIDGQFIYVTLREREKKANNELQKEILLRGSVKDMDGLPLPGVAVQVKGTTQGVSTDMDGEYYIMIKGVEKPVLVFSFVGMETQEVPFEKGKHRINVVLKEAQQMLDQVVVTGIFKKSKESYTGAVSVITEEELKMVGNKNLLVSIGNIDPAFNMLVNNEFGSDPNHLPNIQIRGAANLPTLENLQDETSTDINTPLIIMDGFEIDLQRLIDLNTDEVASITLLKDGSATAIYGSRGANGVIVVTTKEPEAGKLKITYNGSLNIEAPDLSDYNLLNARDKLELERKLGYYESSNLSLDMILKNKYAERLTNVERGVDTDWLSKPLRTGVGQRHSVRLEGGDNAFRYAASLQYNDLKGVMKKSDRKSINGGITLSYYHKNVVFRNDLSIGVTNSKDSPYGSFSDYTLLNPYWKPYDDNGNLIKIFDDNIEFYDGFGKLPKNPLYNATLNTRSEDKYTQIINNFSIEWRPFDGFIARGSVGISSQNSESDDYKPATHTDFEADRYQTPEGAFKKGNYYYNTGKNFNYDLALNLSYSNIFSDRHWVYAGFNMDIESRKSRNYRFGAEGFLDESLDFMGSALQYVEGGKPSGSEALTRRIGFVGNLNYSYDNRYYMDLAFRTDGSSQFGKDKRFAPFYSVGMGWNMEREKFMKNLTFINRLKLRASYGQAGSQNFSAYQAQAIYNYYSSDSYYQWIGAYQTALENANLEWQIKDKYNAGIEVELFDRRLNFMADVYMEKTSNLLSSLDLPLSNGFTSYTANIGKKEDKGFELKATAFVIRDTKRRIMWSLTGSMIHNKDKIIELSPALKKKYDELLSEGKTLPNTILREGDSQNTIYAVRSLGIDPSTGRELFLDKNGEVTYTWSANDRVACGVNQPKYRGNLSSMFRWKDLVVNVSFAYRLGGQLYNSTLLSKIEGADKRYNVDERVYNDRWQNPGDKTFFKSLYDESNTNVTSRFIQDERTLSCQNVHISYNIQNNEWLKKNLGVKSLTVGGNFSDLFYISSVKQERGLSYPYSRRFSFTLGLQF